MRSVTIRAFAKINLSLRVGDVRTDGYHPVQTLLQGIDLFDTVRIVRRPGPFEIRCETKGVPLDRTNLVWKAADVLWQTTGRAGEPRDVLVTLRKGIPMQAGLGGGSSDAAAALQGLSRIWQRRVPDGALHAMAAQLGSDVPYFLVGGTALGLGRGEEVYPLEDLPRLWVVLALPPFGVSTKDAYAWLDESRKGVGRGFRRIISKTPPDPCSPFPARRARQRSRGAGCRPPSCHRIAERTAGEEWGPGGRDVGQRLGGVWRLPVGCGGGEGGARVDVDRRARADRSIAAPPQG